MRGRDAQKARTRKAVSRNDDERTPQGRSKTRLTPELVADGVRLGIRRFLEASSLVQAVRDQLPADDCRQPLLRKVREQFDEQLAIAVRDLCRMRSLAKTTDSVEMLFEAVGEALAGADDLPELLKLAERFAEPSDLDGSSSDNFFFHFAETVVRLTEHLEELCTKYPERFRLVAGELPYWPMLVFRHKAANNHLFEKSADGHKPLAELIQLGSDCPINVSNRANYSLKTPINEFLWSVLHELHSGRLWVRDIVSGKVRRDTPAQTDVQLLAARSHISADEAVLHFRAFALPPLDKRTFQEWVNEVIMPWVRLKYPDLRQVSLFSNIEVGPTGRRYAAARKLLLRALKNLAREPGAGWA